MRHHHQAGDHRSSVHGGQTCMTSRTTQATALGGHRARRTSGPIEAVTAMHPGMTTGARRKNGTKKSEIAAREHHSRNSRTTTKRGRDVGEVRLPIVELNTAM